MLDLPGESALLNIPGLVQAATITSNKPRGHGVDQWLAIKSCEYSSEEEARAAGLRLKDAFLIVGANGLGADFGIDRVRSQFSDEIKQQAKDKFNVVIREEVHGLDVFEDGPVQHLMFAGEVSVHESVSDLSQRLTAATLYPALTSITRTGAELINDSHFRMPDEARFLLRVSAIEAMSEQGPRPVAVLNLIEELIKVAPSLTEQRAASDVMRNVLKEARRQSVRQACLAKLRLRLGRTAAKRFDELYALRSKYLHEGTGRGTFQQPATEALEIAQKLLEAEIRGTTCEPADQKGDLATGE